MYHTLFELYAVYCSQELKLHAIATKAKNRRKAIKNMELHVYRLLADASKTKVDLQGEVEGLRSKYDGLMHTCSDLKNELVSRNNEIKSLKREIDSLRVRLQDHSGEV